MIKVLIVLFVCATWMPAVGQDKSADILLVHAGTKELGANGYSYSSDVTLKYIAEYLWGLLEVTSGYADAQVDYDSEANAHSLADIYYDPTHAALKAQIGSGYRNVILFDSDQAQAYPEILYEGCKKLSDTILDAGSTPLLMMNKTDYLDFEQLGETIYRAGNGCGVEVVPAGYAMELAGLQGNQVAEARAEQAWLSACAIYTKITGQDPAATGYMPSYNKFEWSYNEYYDTRYEISTADVIALRNFATEAVGTHATNEHYNTSYELDGSVVYRSIDVSGEPFNNAVRYFYKGTSTHDLTGERLNTILDASTNDPLSAVEHKIGKLQYDTRDWTTNDLTLRADTFATYADEGLFLYVGGTDEGAKAQDIIDSNQANLVPMVFNWIKGFDSNTGTASTTSALNNEDCADLWDHYHQRGWKTIPLTVGLGRLNEILPNLAASDDDLHLSDPMLYMNASMMLTSALGTELAVPTNMPIRRGSWTDADLSLAIQTGQQLIKELAYLSETLAYVPDSDLSVVTGSLPGEVVGKPYTNQLQAAGGDGVYTWEVVPGSGLPPGLILSSDGLLSGAAHEQGSFSFAVKVTDGTGAFRKAGLKLTIDANSELPVANDDRMGLLKNTTAEILLTGTDTEGVTSNLTYALVEGPTHGTLTGTAPDLTYSPNPDFVGEDRFTFTVSDGVNLSVPATVFISVGSAQTNLEFADMNAALFGNTLVVGSSANHLVVSGAASSFDYIYSVTYTGADYDYDGLNDTLSFDVRAKAWTGGTTELGMDDPGSTTAASATIGTTSAQVTVASSRFTVNGNTMPEGASLEFVVENLEVSLTDAGKVGSAISSGFNAAQLVETHNGHSHQTIFGIGTGLLGWDWNGPFYVNGIPVGDGPLYVSSETSTGTNTRPFHWGVGDVDFGITVSVEIPVVAGYATWASDYGLVGNDALPAADVENGGFGDGYDNLAEFALGMDPTQSDAGSRESVGTATDSGTNYFDYVHHRRSDYVEQGLSYLVIDSTNLISSSDSTNAQDQILVGPAVDGYEPITNRYMTDDPSRFIRLKIRQE